MPAFATLLPLITAGVGALAANKNRRDNNISNAITLKNSALTGRQAQGFDTQDQTANILLKGLAGSFQAAAGGRADAAAQAQNQFNNQLAQQGLDLQRGLLQAQQGGQGVASGLSQFSALGPFIRR